jgi:hypothetical protein
MLKDVDNLRSPDPYYSGKTADVRKHFHPDQIHSNLSVTSSWRPAEGDKAVARDAADW